MKQLTWMYWLVAAALVVAGGVALAFAGGEVEKIVKVNVNGNVDALSLDELADGETREFDAGEHTVSVTRTGDDFSVLLDGEEIGGHMLSDFDGMVWVGEGGSLEGLGEGLERHVIVMKDGGEGEVLTRTVTIHADCDEGETDCETVDVDVMAHPHAMHFAGGGGEHPMIITTHGAGDGMVRYRCEETGSVLLVRQEDALSDTYICPATGCVMEKVTEPEVKVITLEHRIEIEDDDVE
jgi:hypothetical protein